MAELLGATEGRAFALRSYGGRFYLIRQSDGASVEVPAETRAGLWAAVYGANIRWAERARAFDKAAGLAFLLARRAERGEHCPLAVMRREMARLIASGRAPIVNIPAASEESN